MKKGFTLIELIVVIAIIAILSGVILFSVTKYISMGKDSNVSGNMTVLIPAGEQYYNIGSTYVGFCDPQQNPVIKNAISQMPKNLDTSSTSCYADSDPTAWTGALNPANLCCFINSDGKSWAACTREFSNTDDAYCVDSRGMKEEMEVSKCNQSVLTQSGATQCP